MNVFLLDESHSLRAQMHVEKHITKMPLETAQLLCTALSTLGIETIYKPTHLNHPWSQWARASHYNFMWLVRHGEALCEEFRYRRGKAHASESVIKWCEKTYLTNTRKFKMISLTPFPLCMPEEVIIPYQTISSYRNYYATVKQELHDWGNREKPSWIDMYLFDHQQTQLYQD